MPELILFLTAAALLDSATTGQQIVIFGLLLTTARPIANGLIYTLGLSLPYLAAGIIGYLHIDDLNRLIVRLAPMLGNVSNASYYQGELIGGIVFILIVPAVWFYRKYIRKGKPDVRMAMLLSRINPVLSFAVGFFITVIGLPGCVVYFGALEHLTKLSLPFAGAVTSLVYYNVIYVLPMLIVLLLYILMRGKVESLEQKMHMHVMKWNNILAAVVSIGFGILYIVDAAFFLLSGHPLLKTRMF